MKNIPRGALFTSCSGWSSCNPASRTCPRNGLCSAGSENRNDRRRRPAANRLPRGAAPSGLTKFGRWMPSNHVLCRPARKSPGCVGLTNTAALCWARSFSPYATFGQVPVTEVAQALRLQFLRWGLPARLRVDNGTPWGNWNDLPTPFALWVVGLGVDWHWNDPHSPQQNPKIERAQGTGKRWAEPRRCPCVAELQRRLDEADRNHREKYRQRGGKSRWELFPELRHSGRKYTPAWEDRHWSLPRVVQHLSEYVATRTVCASGHVSLYDHGRYVGKQFIGQSVKVQFDPDAHAWLISQSNDQQIRHQPAPEINREQIVKMSFRKKRHKKSP